MTNWMRCQMLRAVVYGGCALVSARVMSVAVAVDATRSCRYNWQELLTASQRRLLSHPDRNHVMEKFKFTVDSALLNELGERLVESVHIALMELIKNSYDADAPKVTIAFGST